MQDILSTFGVIAAIIILGYVTEIIFKKTGIPDVLFLIGTGIALNTGLGWVDPSGFGFGAQLFATFTLVFLLFQGSLNIDFKSLFRSFTSVMKLTVWSFVMTVVVGTAVGMLLGYDVTLSLLFSMILGGTSSAVIIPLVNNIKRLGHQHKLILTLESAISDVLCIVGSLTLITIATTGGVQAAGVFKNILSSFALALVVGAIFGLIWINMVKKSVHLKNAYMVTIAVIIALYAFVESPLVGASGAIAALAFGLMIGNSKSIIKNIQAANGEEINPVISSVLSPSAKNFYAEISFFVKVFFFVYLGVLMDFSDPWIYLWGLIITLAIYLARPFAVRRSFGAGKLDTMTRTHLEVMIPKGLAAAVLAQLAVSSGVPGATTIVPIILAVVLISIVLTSILVILNERQLFRGFFGFAMTDSAPMPPETTTPTVTKTSATKAVHKKKKKTAKKK